MNRFFSVDLPGRLRRSGDAPRRQTPRRTNALGKMNLPPLMGRRDAAYDEAAKMLVEYDLGKPRQAVDVVADMGEETRSAIAGMSLSARGAAMKAAIEAYENGNKG